VALLAAAPLAMLAPAAHAQIEPVPIEDFTDDDAAVFSAVTNTPLGAFAPALSAHRAGIVRSGFGLRLQVSKIDDDGLMSRRNFGVGVDLPVGRSTLSFTAGLADIVCNDEIFEGSGIEMDCNESILAGAQWSVPLLARPMGSAGTTNFTLGTDASFGYGSGDALELYIPPFDPAEPALDVSLSERSISGAVGIPAAIVMRSAEGAAFVVELAPRVAYGRYTADVTVGGLGGFSGSDSQSGVRFMLSGGVAFIFPSTGIGVHAGFSRIFVSGADPALGLGLSLAMR
jgi:hypothetical protein